MAAISLKAHFDGTNIRLDEPFELPPNAQLLVTVLSPLPTESERNAWAELGVVELARAYGDDEPEYTEADIRP
jgi:hypothetical protein